MPLAAAGNRLGVMLRLMVMRTASAVLGCVLLLTGCGSNEIPQSGGVRSTPSPSSPAIETAASLWHCGVLPVTVAGRLLEAVPAQTVDGNAGAPLDSTNTPTDWVGHGTAVVSSERLVYTDKGGETISFVPDDGIEPMGTCG